MRKADVSRKPEKGQLRALTLVAEAIGQLFEDLGYRSLAGKTWALLLFSPAPLDALTLRDRLDVSSGAMSMALGELVTLNLVHRETVPGQRRFYYRAETDLWIVATQIYRHYARSRLDLLMSKLRSAEAAMAEDPAGEQGRLGIEQIQRLVAAGDFVIGLLDAITQRTRVELKAAQKWLAVSGRMGGEPLSRLRRAINASRIERSRRSS